MSNPNNENQKGVAVYLALIIMIILLGIVLGLSVILVRQIKITKGVGDSVFAFFAADTGMERELYNDPTDAIGREITDNLNGATYRVKVIAPGTHYFCPVEKINNCVISTGRYRNTEREILMPR